MGRVVRGDVVRMYDSPREDDPCEGVRDGVVEVRDAERVVQKAEVNAVVALEEEKPVVEPADARTVGEVVDRKRFVQLTDVDAVVEVRGGYRCNGVELDDVNAELYEPDEGDIVEITGVHEALGGSSEDDELVGVHKPVDEEKEEYSSPSSPSPSHTTWRPPPGSPSDDDEVPGDTRRRAKEEVAAMFSGA